MSALSNSVTVSADELQDLRRRYDEMHGLMTRAFELRRETAAKLEEHRHLTRRMLQALDAYWLHYDGLPNDSNPMGRYDLEDWWGRFEKYRAALSSETGNKE